VFFLRKKQSQKERVVLFQPFEREVVRSPRFSRLDGVHVMPLNFPPAPTAYFSRGREAKNTQSAGTSAHVSGGSDVWLRNYPLGLARGERRAVPVEPLTAGRSPRPQARHEAGYDYSQAQRTLLTGDMKPRPQARHEAGYDYSQAQRTPMIPPQNHAQRPSMAPPLGRMLKSPTMSAPPQMQAQASSPESAAARFQNANKGLPDGVRYEPLDEETMKILRRAKGAVETADATSETNVSRAVGDNSELPNVAANVSS